MDITTIIILILYVAGAVLAFKFLKSIAKAMMIVSLVGLLLIGGASYYVIKDARNFQENWEGSPKLMLLEVDGKLIAGMESTLSAGDGPVMLAEDRIEVLQQSYDVNDHNSMLGENYKIFIMKLGPLMDEIEGESLDFGDYTLTKTQARRILSSDDALVEMVNVAVDNGDIGEDRKEDLRLEIEKDIGTDTEVKALVFGILIQQISTEKGADTGLYLLTEYKKGNIIIYPETAMFKLIKYVPNFVLSKAGEMAKIKAGG